MGPASPRNVRHLVLGGLVQCAVLLVAAFAAAPSIVAGIGWPKEFATALLGVSLLPIGMAIRSRRLSAIALAWGTLFLVVALVMPPLESSGGGTVGTAALLIAATAAAAGQAWNLEALTLDTTGHVLRILSQSSIVVTLGLLITVFMGLASMGVAPLLLAVPIDLGLTVATLLTGSLAARRREHQGNALGSSGTGSRSGIDRMS